MVDVLVQRLQVIPSGVFTQAENLAGGGDVGTARSSGIGPDKYIVIGRIQQIVPGGGLRQALRGQFLLESLLVDDDAQNAHVPALPEMIGVIEARIQVIVVGGVVFQQRPGLRQGAVQVHGAAHQEIRLWVAHFRLDAGHSVAAAQGDILDLNAGVLFKLLRHRNGVVLVQRGVHDQFSTGLRRLAASVLLGAVVCGGTTAAPGQQRQKHQNRKC